MALKLSGWSRYLPLAIIVASIAATALASAWLQGALPVKRDVIETSEGDKVSEAPASPAG